MEAVPPLEASHTVGHAPPRTACPRTGRPPHRARPRASCAVWSRTHAYACDTLTPHPFSHLSVHTAPSTPPYSHLADRQFPRDRCRHHRPHLHRPRLRRRARRLRHHRLEQPRLFSVRDAILRDNVHRRAHRPRHPLLLLRSMFFRFFFSGWARAALVFSQTSRSRPRVCCGVAVCVLPVSMWGPHMWLCACVHRAAAPGPARGPCVSCVSRIEHVLLC